MGAERFAAERAGQDPRFTAHPATWLNGQRWEDEPQRPHRAAGAHRAWTNPADSSGYYEEL